MVDRQEHAYIARYDKAITHEAKRDLRLTLSGPRGTITDAIRVAMTDAMTDAIGVAIRLPIGVSIWRFLASVFWASGLRGPSNRR